MRTPIDSRNGAPAIDAGWNLYGAPSLLIRGRQAARSKETEMDKDRVSGAAHQVKGAVKEGVGKLTGDAKTEAEGKAEKAAGKVQNAVGGAKDAVRDATDS
jgi:uncharacterized protein YjbJ (UPF0337 family)